MVFMPPSVLKNNNLSHVRGKPVKPLNQAGFRQSRYDGQGHGETIPLGEAQQMIKLRRGGYRIVIPPPEGQLASRGMKPG